MFVIMMRRADGAVRKMAERNVAGTGTVLAYASLDAAWVEAAQYCAAAFEDGDPWLYYPVRVTDRLMDSVILI